jgi:hypothetical protein
MASILTAHLFPARIRRRDISSNIAVFELGKPRQSIAQSGLVHLGNVNRSLSNTLPDLQGGYRRVIQEALADFLG